MALLYLVIIALVLMNDRAKGAVRYGSIARASAPKRLISLCEARLRPVSCYLAPPPAQHSGGDGGTRQGDGHAHHDLQAEPLAQQQVAP